MGGVGQLCGDLHRGPILRERPGQHIGDESGADRGGVPVPICAERSAHASRSATVRRFDSLRRSYCEVSHVYLVLPQWQVRLHRDRR